MNNKVGFSRFYLISLGKSIPDTVCRSCL